MNAKDAEIKVLYGKAIVLFDKVFTENQDMPIADKVELAETMKRIYARLEQMDKYAEMKAFVAENQ